MPDGESPRLVLTLGRTEEHVEAVLNEFRRNRNVNFASLLDNIAETDASRVSFPYRGYTVIGGEEDERIIMDVNIFLLLFLVLKYEDKVSFGIINSFVIL